MDYSLTLSDSTERGKRALASFEARSPPLQAKLAELDVKLTKMEEASNDRLDELLSQVYAEIEEGDDEQRMVDELNADIARELERSYLERESVKAEHLKTLHQLKDAIKELDEHVW